MRALTVSGLAGLLRAAGARDEVPPQPCAAEQLLLQLPTATRTGLLSLQQTAVEGSEVPPPPGTAPATTTDPFGHTADWGDHGTPGTNIVDRSFLGKGYNTMETDLWTFENVYPTEFYRLDLNDTCFRRRTCSRTEVVETNFFDSITDFSRSFYSSFGIQLSGKFMGIEGSLSASMQKSMAQHGESTKAILEMRIYKRGGCYQMRGECAFDPGSLNPKVLDIIESLPVDSDNATVMALWDERFIQRFGTHVSLGSEHGAQVRAIATSDSNQEGMERFLKSALQADISLDWGEHVGGELSISSQNEEVDERSLAETSYSVRCSAIGGDPAAPSPCIKVEQSKTQTEAHVVEDSLRGFFQPEDLDDGRSVFSMYLKEMADIFNHMGYSKYFHTLTKANEYHRCRWPFHWAKTGEEEHGCKCHLTCQNGGEVDEESCTCKCPADEFHGWTGADCSQPFGMCQVGPNSGNQGAARNCAVDNTCASPLWKAACHSTEVCCLTHFDGACCPFGHSCDCNVNSCRCVPPPSASALLQVNATRSAAP
jgi:hypothetical protein